MNIPSTRRVVRTLIAGTALALLASACGSETSSSDSTATTAVADHSTMGHTGTANADTDVIEVTASDYHFDGLPAQVAAGAKVHVTNASTKEFHELVSFRIPDSEQRSVPELLALGDAKLKEMFGTGEPAMVLLAPPAGAPQIEAVGDGTFTEPGRYIVVCTIPVGADPQEIIDALSGGEDGPPPASEENSTLHYMSGMWAEVVVV